MTDDRTERGPAVGPHPQGDAIALAILTATLTIAGIYTFVFDFWPRTLDIATQFLSWYSYIGDRLASGSLPAWFPYDGAGESMIGSPASGWLSLPIMILFTLFSPITAYKWFIVFHIVLAGFGMYAFARRIGLWPMPSLVAAIAFALGAVYYGSMSFMPPAAQVLIYIPLAMLAADHCLTTRRLSALLGWSALIGLAASQMYVGSAPRVIYGLGFVAIWMLWRILFDPRDTPRPQLALRTGIAGITAGVIGAGFGAAAILPQFDYSAQSHIPHGDYSQVVNGDYAEAPWSLIKILTQGLREWDLFQRPLFYGTGLLVFVLLAPLVSGKRYGVPLFAVTSVVLFDITWTGSLLRPVIVALPGLGPLIEHRPTSSIIFLAVTFPLLAAAGIQWFITDGRRAIAPIQRIVPVVIVLAAIAWMDDNHQRAGLIQIVIAVLTTLLLLLPFVPLDRLRRSDAWYRALAVAAVLMALMLPTISDAIQTPLGPSDDRRLGAALQDDPATEAKIERIVATSDPGTAAEFLQRQQELTQPFRIAAWSGDDSDLWTIFHHMDNRVIAILTHTRASRLGLQQVNSYNPVHIGDYVRYVEIMNGERQDYHTTDPHRNAFIDNGMLSMLNVRYVLVPVGVTDLPGFLTPDNLAYQDAEVMVFENPDAMPRAWIAHDIRSVVEEPYPYSLPKLNAQEYSIANRAFVVGDVPPVEPATGATETVTITAYKPEEITFRTSSASAGLMIASEIYVDGWKAYVDGEEVPIVQTTLAFRGVFLTAGEHTVVMKYEPSSITRGLWGTGITSVAMLTIWIWAFADRRRRPTESGPFAGHLIGVMTSRSDKLLQRLQRLRPADMAGIGAMLLISILLTASLYTDGKRVGGQDLTVFYLPMWDYLGDRLRSFEIPAWNPYQYAGHPFAADPESGWMYLPSMVLFALFGTATAILLWTVLHMLLASIGGYLFARAIGVGPFGAAFTGAATIANSWYYRHTISAPAYIQVGSWIPLTLVFLELAVRAQTQARRFVFAALAAFGFSQIVAAWLGKGALYSLFLIGGYLAWRTLLAGGVPWRSRMANFAIVGSEMSIWTILFSAGGLLPRLQYESVSNLAEGYQEAFADTGWVPWRDVAGRMLGQAYDTPTTLVVLLAILGVILAGRRHHAMYFLAIIATALLLLTEEAWWFHAPFYLIPHFESIHDHYPFQAQMIAIFPCAVLAGIGVDRLLHIRTEQWRASAGIVITVTALVAVGLRMADLTGGETIAILSTLVVAGFLIAMPDRRGLIGFAGCLFVLLHSLAFASRIDAIQSGRAGATVTTDYDAYYAPSGASTFINNRILADQVPYRFFGYDPLYSAPVIPYDVLYRRDFARPQVAALEVNNRATMLHLFDIQGQNNPIQIGLLPPIFESINGFELEYHEAAVFASGLESPYLDLLGVRFIIVPAVIPADRADLRQLVATYPSVYADDAVQVLERGTARDKAFFVSDTIPVTSNEEAIRLITDGIIDPKRVAPVVGSLDIVPTGDTSSSSVTLAAYGHERIRVDVTTPSDQLLVFGEIAYPGWEVTIDGKAADMETAYGGLRAVRVPAGMHTVSMEFRSAPLIYGSIVSGIGYLAFMATLIGSGALWFRRRSARALPPPTENSALDDEAPAPGAAADTGTPSVSPTATQGSPWQHVIWVLLTAVLLMALAAILRWEALDGIRVWTDEPASLLAIEMVANKGLPLFPSDVLYLQGAVFSYLTAPLAWILGPADLLGVTQVLTIGIGIVVIPVAMATVRLLVGGWLPAVITGFLIALDSTLIQWDVTIRPYAMVSLLSVITLYLVVRMLVFSPADRLLWIPTWILVMGAVFLGTFTHPSFWLMMPSLAVVAICTWQGRIFTTWRFLLIAAAGAALSLVAYFGASRFIGIGSGTTGSAEGTGSGSFIGSHLFDVGDVLQHPVPRLATWYDAFVGGSYADLMPLAILLCSAIVAGVALTGSRGQRSPGMTAVLAAHWSVVAIVTLFVVTDPRPRYLIQALPMGYILIGLAVGLVVQGIHMREVTIASVIRLAAVVLVLAPVGAYAVQGADWRLDQPGYEPDYWRITTWVADAQQPGQVIITTIPPAAGVLFDDATREDAMYFLAGPEGSDRATRYAKRLDDGTIGDYWTGTPVIGSTRTLCQTLYRNAGYAWVIVDKPRLAATWALAGDMADVIEGSGDVKRNQGDGALAIFVRPFDAWSPAARSLCTPLIT